MLSSIGLAVFWFSVVLALSGLGAAAVVLGALALFWEAFLFVKAGVTA